MRTITICLALMLGACGFTPQGDALKAEIVQKGAQAYDEGLNNAEFFICDAASIGSIRRAYGNNKADADTYRAFCNIGNNDVDVIGVEARQ